MSRSFLPLLAALASSPSLAAASGYTVALEAPAEARLMVKDVRWSCAGATCTAPRTATSPDANVCASVVRKLGRVTAFQAGDARFDEAQLARCNATAR